MKRIKSNFHELEVLRRASPKLRKAILTHYNKELLNSVSKIILNVLQGNIQSPTSTRQKLCKHKSTLRALADRRWQSKTLAARRRVVIQKGRLLPLLSAVLPTIASILFRSSLGINFFNNVEKMFLASPKQLESMRGDVNNITTCNNSKRKQSKPSAREHWDGLAHDNWLHVKKKEDERILNKIVVTKIAHFLDKVLPSTTVLPASHVPPPPTTRVHKKHVTPLANVKVEAVPSRSPSPEIVYETTPEPKEGEAVDIDEEEAVDFKTRHFGKIVNPYLVRYFYEDGDGQHFDSQYGIRRVGNDYLIGDSEIMIEEASNINVKIRRFKTGKGLWELLTRKNEINAENTQIKSSAIPQANRSGNYTNKFIY
jgi:hypothetical protein